MFDKEAVIQAYRAIAGIWGSLSIWERLVVVDMRSLIDNLP
ncbi:hypothetical protein S1OALGB6SA_1620 [Olavius algarvensis spirochete endosymbiont]|nr:hypothetical protein S1OALGB6SA_1620 [Olavius algarvensis spirochete endosymbiont]